MISEFFEPTIVFTGMQVGMSINGKNDLDMYGVDTGIIEVLKPYTGK